MDKRNLRDRNENDKRFADFCSFYRLITRAQSMSTDRQRTFNQIDHIVISNRFRSRLLDVHNKRVADIGLEREYHLIIFWQQRKAQPSGFKSALRPSEVAP